MHIVANLICLLTAVIASAWSRCGARFEARLPAAVRLATNATMPPRATEVRRCGVDRQSRQGPFAHRESGKQFAASGEDYAKAGRISAREISRDGRAAGMRRSSSPLCGRRGGHPLRSRLRRRYDEGSPDRVDHSLGFSPWEPLCTRHRSLSAPPDKEDSPTSISRLTNLAGRDTSVGFTPTWSTTIMVDSPKRFPTRPYRRLAPLPSYPNSTVSAGSPIDISEAAAFYSTRAVVVAVPRAVH